MCLILLMASYGLQYLVRSSSWLHILGIELSLVGGKQALIPLPKLCYQHRFSSVLVWPCDFLLPSWSFLRGFCEISRFHYDTSTSTSIRLTVVRTPTEQVWARAQEAEQLFCSSCAWTHAHVSRERAFVIISINSVRYLVVLCLCAYTCVLGVLTTVILVLLS